VLVFKRIATVAFIFVTACQQIAEKPALTLDSVTETIESVPINQQELNFSVNDSNVLNLILLAEIALQRKQFDTALEAYLAAAERVDDVRVAEKATRIGRFLNDLDKTDQAVTLWLKNDAKNTTARGIGISTSLKLQNQTSLVTHLDAVLQDSPAAFEVTLAEIQKSLKTKEEIQFIYDSLEALSKRHPQQATLFLSQSILAARQNNIVLSIEKIEKTLILQPNWGKALNFEGELFIHAGKLAYKEKKFSKALKWFDKVRLKKLTFDASFAAITVLGEQKEFQQAQYRLKKLLKTKPKQKTKILIMQAEMYNQQHQYQRAFNILTKILKKSPKNKNALYSRALTAEKLDDLVTLEQDLLKILAQDAKDVGALNALGYTLADKTQRYQEAEKYLKQALTLKPDEAVIIDSYGWLLFKQGKKQAALEQLQKAYDKSAENEIIAHLAEVLWTFERKEEAKKLIADALSKTPEDEYLLKFKQRFLDNNAK